MLHLFGEIQLVLPLLPRTGQARVLLTCNTPEALRLAEKKRWARD